MNKLKKLVCCMFVVICLVCATLMICACSQSGQDATSQIQNGVIADGNYKIDVTLSGGSGKASVSSPASLSVQNGEMVAVIVWSSSNYDLMKVGNEELSPITTEGGSTFKVPINTLDEPLKVQAQTGAMSTPHMIDYTLTFDKNSLKYE